MCIYQLTNPAIGVNSEVVKLGTCSMESDKFITVCENNAGVAQVAIVDMTMGNSVTRQKMSAQAAIMNPVSRVIALRGENLCITSISLC